MAKLTGVWLLSTNNRFSARGDGCGSSRPTVEKTSDSGATGALGFSFRIVAEPADSDLNELIEAVGGRCELDIVTRNFRNSIILSVPRI